MNASPARLVRWRRNRRQPRRSHRNVVITRTVTRETLTPAGGGDRERMADRVPNLDSAPDSDIGRSSVVGPQTGGQADDGPATQAAPVSFTGGFLAGVLASLVAGLIVLAIERALRRRADTEADEYGDEL